MRTLKRLKNFLTGEEAEKEEDEKKSESEMSEIVEEEKKPVESETEQVSAKAIREAVKSGGADREALLMLGNNAKQAVVDIISNKTARLLSEEFDDLEKYIDGLIELVKDQKAYHTLNAKRNHLITERLHHYGIMLVGATIAACFLHLLPVMIPKLHWPEGFSYLLTFLCGFMPALGASLAGINNQGEFKSMFKTSESMNHEYSLFYEELDRLKNSIQSCKEGADVHLFRRIKETAYHISFLMIEELSDWRITYSNRPLDLPT
jgi:hypothetical protein